LCARDATEIVTALSVLMFGPEIIQSAGILRLGLRIQHQYRGVRVGLPNRVSQIKNVKFLLRILQQVNEVTNSFGILHSQSFALVDDGPLRSVATKLIVFRPR